MQPRRALSLRYSTLDEVERQIPDSDQQRETPTSLRDENRTSPRSRWKLGLVALVIPVVASIAWCGYDIVSERLRLQGTWQVLSLEGVPIIQQDGTTEVRLEWPNFWANPLRGPKRIDLRRKVGGGFGVCTWKAVYEWEGTRIRLAEAAPGVCRPTSLDPDQDVVFEGGRRSGYRHIGVVVLQRVPDQ